MEVDRMVSEGAPDPIEYDGHGDIRVSQYNPPPRPEEKGAEKYWHMIYPVLGDDNPIVVDVYCVLDAFDVRNAGLQHAIKKLLCPGKRGVKPAIKDIEEAIVSLKRAVYMEQRRENG